MFCKKCGCNYSYAKADLQAGRIKFPELCALCHPKAGELYGKLKPEQNIFKRPEEDQPEIKKRKKRWEEET